MRCHEIRGYKIKVKFLCLIKQLHNVKNQWCISIGKLPVKVYNYFLLNLIIGIDIAYRVRIQKCSNIGSKLENCPFFNSSKFKMKIALCYHVKYILYLLCEKIIHQTNTQRRELNEGKVCIYMCRKRACRSFGVGYLCSEVCRTCQGRVDKSICVWGYDGLFII